MCYIEVERRKADRKSPAKETIMMTAMINVKLYCSERGYDLDKGHSFICVRSNKLSRFRHQS